MRIARAIGEENGDRGRGRSRWRRRGQEEGRLVAIVLPVLQSRGEAGDERHMSHVGGSRQASCSRRYRSKSSRREREGKAAGRCCLALPCSARHIHRSSMTKFRLGANRLGTMRAWVPPFGCCHHRRRQSASELLFWRVTQEVESRASRRPSARRVPPSCAGWASFDRSITQIRPELHPIHRLKSITTGLPVTL